MDFVAGGGVDDEAGGLVEDHQGVVLVEDVQGDILRMRNGIRGVGPVDLDGFAGMRGVGGFDHAAVDADMAFFDQAAEGAAGDGGEPVAQPGIEPFGGQ